MAYQIEYAYTCHMGKVRANNEDNFWCCGKSLPAENQGAEGVYSEIVSGSKIPALAVFDGMGGESCGEMAAFLASEEFGKYYNAHKRVLRDMPENFIEGVCKNMNDAVCRYGTENHIQSMGSTMAMALFTPESMFICNLGDSRVYFSSGEQFQQLSTDHVLGRSLIGKAPLTQYLGMPEEQQVLEPFVTEIENNSLSETVQNLLEQALQKGGRDNVTIVLCEVQKQESGRRLRTWLKGLKDKNEG